jgi:hypothetical protein
MQMQAGEGEGEQPSGDIRRGPACWHMAHGTWQLRAACVPLRSSRCRQQLVRPAATEACTYHSTQAHKHAT